MEKEVKRGCVISGGGAWGAYGAGVLSGLNKKYDVIAGISTGALMSPLIALNEYELLEEAYTSVNNKSIYDLKWYKPSPVTKKGKMNFLAVLYALIMKKPSLATSNAMRKTIDKFLKKEHYDLIRSKGTNVFVGAQNLRELPSTIKFFDILNCEFEDFKDWMWASAVAPFYCNLVNKKWVDEDGNTHDGQWTDGGVSELVPLEEVLNKMKTFKNVEKEVDVIIHRPIPDYDPESRKIDSLIDNVNSVLGAMRYDIEFEDVLKKAEEFSKRRNATVNVYFIPRKLSANAMTFDKSMMKQWWKEGYESVKIKNENVVTFKAKK